MSTPAKGPSTITGSHPSTDAIDRVVAEPAVSISHQMSAKLARALPVNENAWPIQMAANRKRQFADMPRSCFLSTSDPF